jgi:hypothetical protein
MWHAWERSVYKVLVGKAEGKRPFERPRRRWEDGMRMNIRETGWGSVEWIQLAQHRDQWRALVNVVMNLRVLAPRSQFFLSPSKLMLERCLTVCRHFMTFVRHLPKRHNDFGVGASSQSL